MKAELMNTKICDLLDGKPIKLSKGRNNFSLISERQESQLFNTLHRIHGAQSMELKKVSNNVLSIVVKDWERNVIISSLIETY